MASLLVKIFSGWHFLNPVNHDWGNVPVHGMSFDDETYAHYSVDASLTQQIFQVSCGHARQPRLIATAYSEIFLVCILPSYAFCVDFRILNFTSTF